MILSWTRIQGLFGAQDAKNRKKNKKTSTKKIEYINQALEQSFDVEIDLWFLNKNFFLGHDKPQYKVTRNYLKKFKESGCLLFQLNEI